VHLRDRGGGDGFGELREERVDRLAHLVFDHAARASVRERRQLVLQIAQLLASSAPTTSGRVERIWPNLI
jgi:hypothetical protein